MAVAVVLAVLAAVHHLRYFVCLDKSENNAEYVRNGGEMVVKYLKYTYLLLYTLIG